MISATFEACSALFAFSKRARFSMNLHLPYPEKNRVDAKQADNHINDNAPFANPKWVLFIERKKNIG